MDRLPEAVAFSYCGVGNPFSLGTINADERILDVGCGAGVDTILAGMMAGPGGSAVGVDMVPEMLARAESKIKPYLRQSCPLPGLPGHFFLMQTPISRACGTM
jgi:SAM-dependent methyltransferase